MEQKRIPEDTFQNAFNLFHLLLSRERFGIKYNPVRYILITEHEINLLIKNIEPS